MEGKKIGAIIIILIILAAGYSLLRGGAPAGGDDDVITIGFVGPLTGDGVSYGEPISNGARLAVDEINAAGGVNGRTLEIIYEDGKCASEDALNAARKLVNIDGVKIIVGGMCSGETFAVLPVAEEAGVVVISPASTSPDLTGISPYFFRNAPSDDEGGRSLARFATKEYKKIALISEETDFAQGFARVFRESVFLNGGEVVADESYAPDTSDFRSILTKIKAAEPEALFVNPQTEIAGGAIVKQARELGITAALLGSNVVGASKSVEIAGDHLEGLVYVDAPGLNPNNPKAAAFLDAYRMRYGGDLGIEFLTASTYDVVYIFAQAIEMVGSADDPEALRSYISTMGNFNGAIGSYRFRPDGDPEGIEFIVKRIEDGEGVVVE